MSVEYSTMPLALRGANAMSTITELRGSWRIDLAERAPDKLLVLADVAERHAFERRRLDARDHDSANVGLGECCPTGGQGEHSDCCDGSRLRTSQVRRVIGVLLGKA